MHRRNVTQMASTDACALQVMLLLEQAIETLAFVRLDEKDFDRVEPLGAGITTLPGCFHPQAAASESGKSLVIFQPPRSQPRSPAADETALARA
jgi:hypothetical protein